jgi:hypothetical protein
MPEGDGTQNLNQGDGGGIGWRAQLPDTLKTNETFTAYKTVGELAQSHLETAGKVKEYEGKLAASIPKLTDKATDEDRAAYYKAIGRPEKADDYAITVPEGVPKDEAAMKWFRDTSHKLGLSKQQGESLAAGYFEMMKGNIDTINKAYETRKAETVNKLKGEWGGKYEENFDLAKKTAQKIGGEDIIKYLGETGIGNEPVIIKFMHKLGTMLSEAAFVKPGTPPPETPATTPGGQPLLRFPSMEKK